jgi:ribosomal protein S18 acetylase RimI-like enzyme
VSDAPRRATSLDREDAVEVLVGAFHEDPTWAWACPDAALRAEQHRELWRLFVDGALRYDGVWVSAGGTAVAVWIPPGGTELSPEQEQDLEDLLDSWPGEAPARVRHAVEQFEAAHPHGEPHHYLTLLGTDPGHRGRGAGLGLLAATLARVDEAGSAAYLEASNPANVPLYQRYGFAPVGSFQLGADGPAVITMWRPAGAARPILPGG